MNEFMLKAAMLLAVGDTPATGTVETSDGASIGQFLASFQATLARYGSIAVSIIGVAMVVVAIYQIAKGLMSGGKGQTNWVMTIALLLIGGALALTSGWKTVGQLVETGNTTLDKMSNGQIDEAGKVTSPFQDYNTGDD